MKTYQLEFRQNLITRQWRWRIKADNGKIVGASSESFWRKKGCEDNARIVLNSLAKYFNNGKQ